MSRRSSAAAHSHHLRARVEILESHRCRIVGKSQSFLMMITPMLFARPLYGSWCGCLPAQGGVSVTAVEVSGLMLGAAHALLNGRLAAGALALHPYVSAPLSNEISDATRFRAVRVPDASVAELRRRRRDGSQSQRPPSEPQEAEAAEAEAEAAALHLSFLHADFVQRFSAAEFAGTVDYVVSCFFLDAVENVETLLGTIAHVLRVGGRWLNLGPLQVGAPPGIRDSQS
jgi:hypothetical protein